MGYVSHSKLKLVTKSDYYKKIRVCMGGMIAEELVYGKDNVSAGAVGDLQTATNIARTMTERWGFSDEFGFMALSQNVGKYLGGNTNYTCSDAFREKSDIAVSELLKKLYQETLGMLGDKKDLIIRLAKRVFEKETMTGEAFKKLYEAECSSTSSEIKENVSI